MLERICRPLEELGGGRTHARRERMASFSPTSLVTILSSTADPVSPPHLPLFENSRTTVPQIGSTIVFATCVLSTLFGPPRCAPCGAMSRGYCVTVATTIHGRLNKSQRLGPSRASNGDQKHEESGPDQSTGNHSVCNWALDVHAMVQNFDVERSRPHMTYFTKPPPIPWTTEMYLSPWRVGLFLTQPNADPTPTITSFFNLLN